MQPLSPRLFQERQLPHGAASTPRHAIDLSRNRRRPWSRPVTTEETFMMKTLAPAPSRAAALPWLSALFLLAATGCGGGGGDSADAAPAPAPAPGMPTIRSEEHT